MTTNDLHSNGRRSPFYPKPAQRSEPPVARPFMTTHGEATIIKVYTNGTFVDQMHCIWPNIIGNIRISIKVTSETSMLRHISVVP